MTDGTDGSRPLHPDQVIAMGSLEEMAAAVDPFDCMELVRAFGRYARDLTVVRTAEHQCGECGLAHRLALAAAYDLADDNQPIGVMVKSSDAGPVAEWLSIGDAGKLIDLLRRTVDEYTVAKQIEGIGS